MAARPGFDQRDSFPEVVPSVLPEVVDKWPQNRLRSGFTPHRSQAGVVTASPSGTSGLGDYTAHQRQNSSSTPDLDEDIYSDNSRQNTPLASNYSISGQTSRTGLHVDSYQPQGSTQSNDTTPLNGSGRTRPVIEDRGFSVVSDLSGQNAVVDIVFVHGLQGHPEKTFTATSLTPRPNTEASVVEKKSKNPFNRFKKRSGINQPSGSGTLPSTIFWPFDLLAAEPDFTCARILTWGYNSQVTEMFNSISHENISQQGHNFMVALQQIRKKDSHRPLIFVAHSLGGLLVKVALARSRGSKNRPQYLPIYQSAVGIIFLGTPQSGSGAADWGLLASNLAKLALRGRNASILRGLIPNNELLENLSEEFLHLLGDEQPGISFHSFYETAGMTGIPGLSGEVVPRKYAIIGHLRETVMGIDGNHSEICKFPGPRHHGYVAVLGALEDYVGLAVLKRSAQAGSDPSLSLASPASWDASEINDAMPTLRITPQPRTEMPSSSGSALQHETVERPQALTQSDQLQSRFSEGKNLVYSNVVFILTESNFSGHIDEQTTPFESSNAPDQQISMSTSSLPRESTDGRVVNDIYFAVMGASGVGKSSFIHLCTGKQDIWANGDQDFYRSKIQPHAFMLDEHTRINLLDTPGFDDPFLNEAYVLESIAQRLCSDYRQGRYISGMIYLQKITDSLGEGTASLGNLRMFQELCGSHAYRSLNLVTTHWDRGSEFGDLREQELTSKRHLWGSMAQSIVARHDNTSASARAIITSLLKRTEEVGQVTLKIQYEVINDGLLLSETSAGIEVTKYVEMRSHGVQQQLLALPLQVELATEAGDPMLGRELSKLMEQSEAQIKSDMKSLEALKTRI